jgi:hypothetical protein
MTIQVATPKTLAGPQPQLEATVNAALPKEDIKPQELIPKLELMRELSKASEPYIAQPGDGTGKKLYFKSKAFLSKLNEIEGIHKFYKIFFADDSIVRKVLSLENELAEAADPTWEQLKAPPMFRKLFYNILWGMTFVTTGVRSMYEAIQEQNPLAGAKKVVQDGVSVVALTTIAARTMNAIQEKIYNSANVPHVLKNVVRPLVTILGCVKGIHYFDKPGEWAGDKVYKFLKQVTDKYEAEKQSARIEQDAPAVILRSPVGAT